MKLSRLMVRWPVSFVFGTPYTCNIKITQRCNLSCHFCGLWKLANKQELSLSQYSKVAALLLKLGLARVVITGGEPFMREDLPEIISLFSRKNFSTTLLTNGTLASESNLVRIKVLGLHDIGISLDTLRPELQEEICGQKGVWHRIITTIRHCTTIFENKLVKVMTTITDANIAEIIPLIEFIQHDLKAWIVLNPVNVPRFETQLSAPGKSAISNISPQMIDSLYDKLALMKRKGVRILNSKKFLEQSRVYLKTQEFSWRCDAGSRYFTIFSDGALSPCSDTAEMANVLELTKRQFFGREMQTRMLEIRESCNGCIYSCWREASLLFTDPSVILERISNLISMLYKGFK